MTNIAAPSLLAFAGSRQWRAAYDQTILGVFNVKDFGAAGDTRMVTDAVLVASSSTVTSATAAFTSADVGKVIYGVETASGLLRLPRGTIVAVNSASSITVSTVGAGNYSNIWLVFGTDDSDAIRDAVAAAKAVRPMGTVTIPRGGYLFRKCLFDCSHPDGGGGATIDIFRVEGDGSGRTTLFMDPSFDFTTTSTANGAVVKNLTGGNVNRFAMNGLGITGAGCTFSAGSYHGMVLGVPTSAYRDLRIERLRGFITGVQITAQAFLDQCFVGNDVGAIGVQVNQARAQFRDTYVGNCLGTGVEVYASGLDNNENVPITFTNCTLDECTGDALVIKEGSHVLLIGGTAFGGGGGVNSYAVSLANDGEVNVLHGYGARFTAFGTGGDRGGINNPGALNEIYLQGCIVDRAGAGKAFINGGTYYDLGGNAVRGDGVTGSGTVLAVTMS